MTQHPVGRGFEQCDKKAAGKNPVAFVFCRSDIIAEKWGRS